MTGFPTRPDRDGFGPTVIDTAAVVDPRKQISAALFNLLWHQTAGLGLVAPRAYLRFTADTSPVILERAEAWNPSQQTGAPFADPGIAKNGTGDYQITYTSPVTNQDGDSVAIAFQSALGFQATIDDPTTLKSVRVATQAANPNQLRVAVFDAAGALEDGNDVVVIAW